MSLIECVDRRFEADCIGFRADVIERARVSLLFLVRSYGIYFLWDLAGDDEPESLILAQSERWRHA